MTPSEIAREALRQLAIQRVPPTPDNYRVHYLKISGEPAGVIGFDPHKQLAPLIEALPREKKDELLLADRCAKALQASDWGSLIRLLSKALAPKPKQRWSEILSQITSQLTGHHPRLALEQKQEALKQTLLAHTDSDELIESLVGLSREWGPTHTPSPSSPANPAQWQEAGALAGVVLDTLLLPMLADAQSLADETKALAAKARNIQSAASGEDFVTAARRLALRIEFHLEDRAEIQAGTLNLLQLVIDNIGELVLDEQWLAGQMEVLRHVVSGPLNVRTIDDAEAKLKDILFKQGQLKHGLTEAQNSLKTMLAGFVDQLASFAQSTGAYHDKIEGYAEKISTAGNITQLSQVIEDVMRETRAIQLTAQRTRDDLEAARAEVSAAEKRVAELEQELSRTSELVRMDQLTGALNRRGLEEAFDKEISRAQRRDTRLCVGVLDIDNFKKLNDSLGHDAGDAALIHLVRVVRDAVRPQDTVARYGGEEFVILMPDTPLEDAQAALIRVQRELTRRFFMHNNQKILITFSAGVTELPRDGTAAQAIKKADELMYQAKTTGKNKVVAA